MRILICASDTPLPPYNTGYRRQLRGLLDALSDRHDVRLVGYRMPEQSMLDRPDERMRIVPWSRARMPENVKAVTAAAVTRTPVRANRYVEGLLPAMYDELARFDPDVVHVGPGKLAGMLAHLGGRPAILNVMDTWHLNQESRADAASGLRRLVLRLDTENIKRFEARAYRGWDRIVASNEDDLGNLAAQNPSLPLTIIPIGFDASAYAPDPGRARDGSRIMFHGALDYPPNVECVEYLAQQILPIVRTRRPDAYLAIVGRDPSPRVQALGALEGVDVVGGVDDMRAWLTGSAVWAAPFLSGTGIKTKLLEAMAADLPSVVTPLGARGLAVDSNAFLVAETTETFAAELLRVLDNQRFAAALGRAGGECVRSRYDWPVVSRAFERLYQDVIAEKAAAAATSA